MKASEARNIAQSKIDSEHYKQYDKVIDVIKRYAQGGFFEVAIFEELLPSVQKRLLDDGFKYHFKGDGRNGYDYKISWK